MQGLLPPSDFWPVDTVSGIAEARRRLIGASYDLVIINSPLPDDSGTGFAADLCARSDAGVLLLVRSEIYEETYYKLLPSGAVALSKPLSLPMMSQALRMLCALRERLRALRQQQSTVEEKIDEIRLVNRAKWLLIECLHMTEAEAHRHLVRQAMEQRCSKREAAENIIRTYQ